MKSYNFTYDLTNRAPKTVYVSKNSTYKVGIKTALSSDTIKLYDGSTEISADSDKFHGYNTFELTAGENASRKNYKVAINNVSVDLFAVTTDSDVAELGSGSSELPIASASQLGGVKVGSNLAVAADGTLSVNLNKMKYISGFTFRNEAQAEALTIVGIYNFPAYFNDIMDTYDKLIFNGFNLLGNTITAEIFFQRGVISYNIENDMNIAFLKANVTKVKITGGQEITMQQDTNINIEWATMNQIFKIS